MRILVTGVTGQDGHYLARQLLGQENIVYGMVRGQDVRRMARIEQDLPGLRVLSGDLLDSTSLASVIEESEPDVVYNLAGLSAPGTAWIQPILAGEVNGLGFLRLATQVERIAPRARILQACSLATHGPYGASKTYSAALAADFRERGTAVYTATMGGHHSPRRGLEFFSARVARAVAEFAEGLRTEPLPLGWLGRSQDWGWAPDFTQAMQLVVARDEPDEYVLSTGEPHSTSEWVVACFEAADLGREGRVVLDASHSQPTDVPTLTAEPDKRLGWRPNCDFAHLAQWMVNTQRGRIQRGRARDGLGLES